MSDLREQLTRLAEDAPVASVPADTFARGRRSHRRREAAGTALLVSTMLAVLSGVLWQPLLRHLLRLDASDGAVRRWSS